MSPVTIVILSILGVLIVGIVVFYFLGKKAEKKQAEQQEQIEANKQTVSMLIIDKKKMPLKEAGLPQVVIDQTPKLLRRSKMPIVKAKVGPQIMTLICDDKIFDLVPVKKEVRASISGIYIVDVRGSHGKSLNVTPAKKKGIWRRAVDMARDKVNNMQGDGKKGKKKK